MATIEEAKALLGDLASVHFEQFDSAEKIDSASEFKSMIGCVFLIFGRKSERETGAYLKEMTEHGEFLEKLQNFPVDGVSAQALLEF